MYDLEKNILKVRERIRASCKRANRQERGVKLIAVTKTFSPQIIQQAIKFGVTAIAENIVQEAKEKYETIGKKVEWHFVGHLQSNKARDAAEIFDMIQSIDREKIARKISNRCLDMGKVMPVLVQVNTSDKTYGIKPEKVSEFINKIKGMAGIKIDGLMTIAPLEKEERVRNYFRQLKKLVNKCKLKELSMGMSNDFEIAIEEGATMVRIGTAIFGERK